MVPVSISTGHGDKGVGSPAADEHKEDGEGDLSDPDLNALARVFLVAGQRFYVHFLSLLL